jgi:predicted metal-dependent peptidase
MNMTSLTQNKTSVLTKKEALESALLKLFQSNPFYGSLIQSINIRYSDWLPTACIAYDKKKDQFFMDLNYEYFATKPVKERCAILYHEILHFAHQHIWRWMSIKGPDDEQKVFNIAADMAINQYIMNKPDGWVDVAKFRLKTGQPFPLHRPMEEYYKLLKEIDGKKAQEEAEGNKGKGQPGTPGHEGKTQNQDELEKFFGPKGQQELDVHNWDELDADEKQKMLEEAKKLVERTMEKTSYSASQLPGHIKDLIEELETQIAGINYKRIIKEIIKKTISTADRESTWNRPSKRFGIYSQGTKCGRIPKIMFFMDTSGSISYTEMSEFLKTCDGFLRVGQKTSKIGLWNTELYKTVKYTNHSSLVQTDIQSGGTDVSDTLKYIDKHKPDLSIILTDGYLDTPKHFKSNANILWVISKQGNTNHPYKEVVGKTVQIK